MMDLEKIKVEDRVNPPLIQETRPHSGGFVSRRVASAANALRGRTSEPLVPSDSHDVLQAPDQQIRRRRPYLWSFVSLVVLPSLLVLIYFVFIASNQFQSESRFAVRAVASEESDKSSDTGTTPATTNSFSFTSPSQNAYIVMSYIRSRAVIDDIGSEVNVREIFQRPEADFWVRLKPNASIDELADYWNGMVDAYVDPISGIVTVNVTAFRAEDAYQLSQAVLTQSEKLVNRISDKARRDATKTAEEGVKQAFGNVQASLRALQDFRNKDAIIDPGQSTSQIGKLLMPLLTEKLKLENDQSVMSAELGPDAPSLRALRSRIASLETQITNLRSQLTGSDSRNVATSLAKFEELDVERILNERKYARAQSDLDRAEVRARRQAIYLSTFVSPSTPEYAKFPYRFTYSAMMFVLLLILWSIGALIHASVEDHRL